MFEIVAAGESALLCRILGYLAQLGVPAPAMTVSLEGEAMHVHLKADVPEKVAAILETRFAGLVGVHRVRRSQKERTSRKLSFGVSSSVS